MKKLASLLVAVLAFVVLAAPADARGRNRDHNRGYGRNSEFAFADQNVRNTFMLPIRQMERNLNYGYRYRYPLRGNIYFGHSRHNSFGIEEPSKCFARVVKNARKQHVRVDAAEVMAFCNGQTVASSETSVEPPPQEQESEEQEPSAVEQPRIEAETIVAPPPKPEVKRVTVAPSVKAPRAPYEPTPPSNVTININLLSVLTILLVGGGVLLLALVFVFGIALLVR